MLDLSRSTHVVASWQLVLMTVCSINFFEVQGVITFWFCRCLQLLLEQTASAQRYVRPRGGACIRRRPLAQITRWTPPNRYPLVSVRRRRVAQRAAIQSRPCAWCGKTARRTAHGLRVKTLTKPCAWLRADGASHSAQPQGELVIDGGTLDHVLGPKGKGLEKVLADVCARCGAVVICRSSPSQKAAVVRMMSEYEMSQARPHKL